eukprot:gb/GECH01009525.1/.p1 GENE.gb/GECH01009525.1/~~gb/GECH01009525.1/.p1  ORF type:complete len:309 (+),score=45.70 gb/GECH01009525.1/:1-927(+)
MQTFQLPEHSSAHQIVFSLSQSKIFCLECATIEILRENSLNVKKLFLLRQIIMLLRTSNFWIEQIIKENKHSAIIKSVIYTLEKIDDSSLLYDECFQIVSILLQIYPNIFIPFLETIQTKASLHISDERGTRMLQLLAKIYDGSSILNDLDGIFDDIFKLIHLFKSGSQESKSEIAYIIGSVMRNNSKIIHYLIEKTNIFSDLLSCLSNSSNEKLALNCLAALKYICQIDQSIIKFTDTKFECINKYILSTNESLQLASIQILISITEIADIEPFFWDETIGMFWEGFQLSFNLYIIITEIHTKTILV